MVEVTAINDIKGVLFDLDGTLLNTLDDLAEAMNFALRRSGLPVHPVNAYRSFVGDGVDLLVRRACAPVDDEGIIKQCAASFRKRYAVCWSRRTAPYNGIEAMLDELETGRLFLAILSNKPHTTTTEVIRHYFAGRHFTVCLGNGIFPRKPNPQAALYIASVMGIRPANCLYVGDTGTDMQTAQAAGMPSAGALWGFREERELREMGASWIAQRPADVVEIVRNSNGEQ